MVRFYVIFLILFGHGLSLLSQDKKDSVISFKEEPFGDFYIKEYPCCDTMRYRIIKENIRYPETALDDYMEGTVYVGFWVELDGTTTQYEILRGIRDDLDNEALRVIKLFRFYTPAINYKDEPVRYYYQLPIQFSLKDKNRGKEH